MIPERKKISDRKCRFRSLVVESLESRYLLANVDILADEAPSPAWFASAHRKESMSSDVGFGPGPSQAESRFVGPRAAVQAEWVIQLTADASAHLGSFSSIDRLLQSAGVDFEAIRGLGLRGLVHVRTYATTASATESALLSNPYIASHEVNTLFRSAFSPNDTDFSSLVGLHNVGQFGSLPDADIDAVEAWDSSTGSPSVVVGVIDSGIDATHPDLYLNIWINQGEIVEPLRSKLMDTDLDGLITFYDLNAPANASFVRDLNSNGYIDAIDLLRDPSWTDGLDTDRNGFIDDFFGWNFRDGTSESFAPNNPSDILGHGSHVAGTIGAIGNNERGVAGVNWKTSLMSLKFLDQNNQGDTASAIAAINYATMMRTQYSTNVRVLNSSWGQPGSPNTILRNAILSAGEAGILVAAAAGNGNVLGQGVDNDRTPFYPASYDLENIVTVAASDGNDRLAPFSNFGISSVDIAAPGVGVRSTLPGGRYGDANGTSMATPLVAGTAALLWSVLPQASVAEVRRALLESVDLKPEFINSVSSGGRLNAFSALQSTIFAPVAEVVTATNVVSSGGDSHEITVRYTDRNGLNTNSIGDDDLLVSHQWGNRETLSVILKASSIQSANNGTSVTATYILTPPGGTWDPLDFGAYSISTVAGSVLSQSKAIPIRSQAIGRFDVKIIDPSIVYVDSFLDANGNSSLRHAIEIANGEPSVPRTILLEGGRYAIEIPYLSDPGFNFFRADPNQFCTSPQSETSWSSPAFGDFDILGNVTIVGDLPNSTVIDAQGLDRVFKVHPGASLSLKRLTVAGGVSPPLQGGGGILSAGILNLDQVHIRNNAALGTSNGPSDELNRGGGIAVWAGDLNISQSRISENQSDIGGGLMLCGKTEAVINQTTIDNNRGGGVVSYASTDARIENSTVASNFGGAIQSRARDFDGGSAISYSPTISRDGQRVSFLSNANNLVPKDTNNSTDVFVTSLGDDIVERVNVSSANQQANSPSEAAAISGDGTTVIFYSAANNLTTGDDAFSKDLFTRSLASKTTTLESPSVPASRDTRGIPAISDNGQLLVYQQAIADDAVNGWGVFVTDRSTASIQRLDLAIHSQAVNISFLNSNSVSGDGRFIALASEVSGTLDGTFHDIFVYDRQANALNMPALRLHNTTSNGSNFDPVFNFDGRFLAFTSDDSQLVSGDSNQAADIFVYDQTLQQLRRINLASNGSQADQPSSSPAISSDGRFVAFSSLATNLVPGDSNSASDIFVVDRTTGNVERVSMASDGSQANGASFSPSISGDGRYIAFESESNNLDAGNSSHRGTVGPSNRQVYVFDRIAKTVRCVSAFSQMSTVHVNSSTLAYNTGDETISGNVTSSNSLYAGNFAAFDFGSKTASLGNNVLASASSREKLHPQDILARDAATKLGPFSSIDDLPPGYPLLLGNPAIDAASSERIGTLDQWNRLRIRPDAGALEAVSASATGSIFVDLNSNLLKDSNEVGLADITVFLDANGDGINQSSEIASVTAGGSLATVSNSDRGEFSFRNIPPTKQNFRAMVPDEWQASAEPLSIVGIGAVQGNGNSTLPAISPSGRVIAFLSNASNLVAGDGPNPNVFVYSRDEQSLERLPHEGMNLRVLCISGEQDQFVLLRDDTSVFLYDRKTKVLEPVSLSNSGELANGYSDNASANQDGNWIAFSSFAKNLVPNDSDDFSDIFLFHRAAKSVISVTLAANSVQGNNDSEEPSISSDGRFIAFVSDASNLVEEDRNGLSDIFVYDRIHGSIRRVNVSGDGSESNGFSYPPSISGNGRFVVFQSLASNLVAGDTNAASDLFVVDVQTSAIERLEIPFKATSQAVNYRPSISEDGQYIVFEAYNSILAPSDTSLTKSVFVYDRFTSQSPTGSPSQPLASRFKRISQPSSGQANNGDSVRAAISKDGRTIAFQSTANNLVVNDTNQLSDIFTAPNPFESASRSVTLQVGQELTALTIGLSPKPGRLSGTLFNDVSVDEVFDLGDPGLAGWTVYLDVNNNGRRDGDEPIAMSNENGSYLFEDVPSFREYSVGVETPLGWVQMTPLPNTNGSRVFLPAAGNIDQRNFGFAPRGSTGQSENARIEGRVFTDSNQDGVQQANEPGNPGVEIYLDLNANERRDFDEPRNVSDSLGNYSFSSLGSRSYTVRALLGEGNQLTSPVGNKFSSVEQAFSSSSTVLSKPQDVIVEDFDGLNGPDIAVALYSGNSIVIQLNDGQGGFSSTPVTVNIAPNGKGPVAMASGNLNGPIAKDLVVANALNSTISVFLDFDGTGFKSSSLLSVDAMPTKIVLADIDSDSDLDIVVASQTTNATGLLKIYLNNGQGVFTSGASISSGGKRPMSMVIQDLNRDQVPDIAIANQGDFGRANDNGNVSVILGLGNGGFAPVTTYLVGAGPLGIDASDLNGDGFQDLVVVNFSVNTASVLRGSATGSFTVLSEQLSVGQGPVQVSLFDIDGDQDDDILVSNLRSRSLSILRNRLGQEGSENPNSMLFEPAESFGVAQIATGPRLVFAAGDFDRSGTVDLALMNSESNSLTILSNEWIDGAHRIQVTGVGTTNEKNFGIRSEILKPSMDPFISPIEVLEDASPLSISMTGIKRGRVVGPPLRVTAFSSNPSVVPHPSVAYTEGSTTGRLAFATSKDAQGQAILSVVVRDAGADGQFDTSDDGTMERTVLVSVKPVNDPPSIVLRGNQIITQGSNLRTVLSFATAFRPGGGIDEQSQSIAEFIVTNDRTDLFLSQPAIDNDGNLRYQPSLTGSGAAKIGVQVRDNGGTDSGGLDRSSLQFFQIFVTDLADGDIDFGDAPTAAQSRLAASYPTQLKDNGARHRTGQLYLGSLVDAEQDGQPTHGALGDDQKIDDEDGISFAVTAMSSPIVPTIASLVAIASANSKLDAWIDFNQDGDWSDSGEQILAAASVTTGRNLIGFTIPAGSKAGMTYARFRLSSLGGLGVTGLAEDGEVEDHPIQILDTQETSTLTLFESELGQHELFVTGGSLVVLSQGKPIFSGPASNIERVLLVTSTGQSRYEIQLPMTNLFGTLQFVDSSSPITISTSEPKLNLAGFPTGSLYGIRTLDFSVAVPQVLQINVASIGAFNSDKSVRIVLGDQDTIESSLGWVLETRLLEQGKLVHVFKQSDSLVRMESSLPWQNPIHRLDADGDGIVSPLDVLVIINHLNRSSGSNTPGNLPLFDPSHPKAQHFVDTNGSNNSEPLDVLVVINHLNQRDTSGEGESSLQRNTRDRLQISAILEMYPELPDEDVGRSP